MERGCQQRENARWARWPVRYSAALWASVIVGWSNSAQAGMTVYGLKDVYRIRLEELSFFLALLLICTALLRSLWNYGFAATPRIPRLSFRQSFCLSLLLGLSMLLILAMISGIREVLTPDAWRHQGTSYRLNDPSQEPARRRSLEHLRAALFDYARAHEGKFPPHDYVAEITEKLWESPDQFATRYLYTGGLRTNDTTRWLAVEPVTFGDRPFALWASGIIDRAPRESLDSIQPITGANR